MKTCSNFGEKQTKKNMKIENIDPRNNPKFRQITIWTTMIIETAFLSKIKK